MGLSKNALVHEHMSLKRQYDQMMRNIDEDIKNAKTEKEINDLLEFKQSIFDEFKKVETYMCKILHEYINTYYNMKVQIKVSEEILLPLHQLTFRQKRKILS